jgi:hypothetical protein
MAHDRAKSARREAARAWAREERAYKEADRHWALGGRNLKSWPGLLVARTNQRDAAMKVSSLILAAALALPSSFSVAQQSEDGNGLSLGKSMPGSTAGVPYPDRAATTRTGPVAVGGEMGHGAAYHRRHRKHHHLM